MTPPDIRPGTDNDGPGLIALIWSCWSRYPGIRMDVDREMPELHALASYYADQGGMLWIAEGRDGPVGMIAARPAADGAWEICRVYVAPALHGGGLGHRLLDVAEAFAMAGGAERLVLWSDTRFDRAHGFYEKRSYVRQGAIRVLNDISNSLEYGYAKPVNGAMLLDIAAATAASRRLGEILATCVEAGAPMAFLPPLAPDRAAAFYRRTASEIGSGKRLLVAAWRNAVLVGSGTLDLDMPENQRHRAEMQMVLVHPPTRRLGIGRMIVRTLEQQAAASGRTLLTLNTRADDAGESLFRVLGWQEAGRIPGYAVDAGGVAHATLFFWKALA
ncbi:MAG TPA: GNAT family N-acetyltransferase [Rhodopila sp.]|nr:GNAT family N-acetyltransferase [Rhodopila sp.]